MLRLLGFFMAAFCAASLAAPFGLKNPDEALAHYRSELARFRTAHGGSRDLPDIRFFQFGMGARRKLLFRDGKLIDAADGTVVRQWTNAEAVILPSHYAVVNRSSQGEAGILEDESGVWIWENGRKTIVPGSESAVRLPSFETHPFPGVLRVLHHEILMNIVGGQPVPNFYVYRKPWLRDGAMMALCLQKTGNLKLIGPWIASLREPYDRNNNGETEADNLGQALFLASLAGGANHPVVAKVLAELPRWEVHAAEGAFIRGRSDFAEHPVYQTKWLKFGLRALGLPDKYAIPAVRDSYSALFWMDYRAAHVPGGEADDRKNCPYLGWAADHFLQRKQSPISNRDYPLTWESNASQADYNGMHIVAPVFTENKISAPHTWHAAEVFLYLLD